MFGGWTYLLVWVNDGGDMKVHSNLYCGFTEVGEGTPSAHRAFYDSEPDAQNLEYATDPLKNYTAVMVETSAFE